MSLTILPDLVQGSDEWMDQRRGMVTASVVQGLLSVRAFGPMDYLCPSSGCGAEPHEPCRSKVKRGGVPGASIKTVHSERSTLAVTLRNDSPLIVEPANNETSKGLTALLTAERITGYTDPTYMNDDMLRGVEDEPRAIAKYAEHYAPVKTVGLMVRDDWGFKIGFSPDGLVGDGGLVEVKSRRQKIQLLTVLADEVPVENMGQLQTGLLVSGWEWIDYISYCGGMKLYVKRVYPDPRWFEAIVQAVAKFESTSAAMISTYKDRTRGMPMTERVTEMEMVI